MSGFSLAVIAWNPSLRGARAASASPGLRRHPFRSGLASDSSGISARAAMPCSSGHDRPLGGQLANRAEQRPRPAALPLQRLREPDEVTGVAGVQLDHAARDELVVRPDDAALRRLPVLRM